MTSDPLDGVRVGMGGDTATQPRPAPVPFGDPFYRRAYDRKGRMSVRRYQWVRYASGKEYLKFQSVPVRTVPDPESLPIGSDNRAEVRCPNHGSATDILQQEQYLYLVCGHCDEIVTETTVADGQQFTMGQCVNPDFGALLGRETWGRDVCARCGNPHDINFHHYAPREFFDDADDWGTVVLCESCHQTWHRVVKRHGLGA